MIYTNELLEEKYKAQKILIEKAEKESLDYLKLVEKGARELFEQKGWEINFSKRKGVYLKYAND